jgi:hypothetical protein
MFGVDVVGELDRKLKPSEVCLARCRTRDVPDPIHEALEIDRHRGGQMMQRGLVQTSIPCPPHAEGKGGLRHGPFDAGSPFVVFFTTRCVLALASRLERQMLHFGMERQPASFGCAPGTSLLHKTRSTIRTIKRDLEGRLAARSLRRFPGPTLFAHGTDDDFLLPINLKVAGIKSLGVMSLPALILTQRTQQIHLVLALTTHELCARGGGPIDHMDPRKAVVLRKRLVNGTGLFSFRRGVANQA